MPFRQDAAAQFAEARASTASVDKALRLLLAEHVQLCIVVDEFGSLVGVLAMEDIVESILGQEIFEHDDLAVDMRELAKKKYLDKLDSSNQQIFWILKM